MMHSPNGSRWPSARSLRPFGSCPGSILPRSPSSRGRGGPRSHDRVPLDLWRRRHSTRTCRPRLPRARDTRGQCRHRHRIAPRTAAIGAADLDPELHGRFDLIFSNNVLEHIDDPVAALHSMRRVLTDGGVMIHSCPNYSVPFEPHFGFPLIPGRPAATRRVLPASISSSDVWNSLNFVTARQIRQWSTDLGLTTRFRSGALATSVERLGTDTEFRDRHRALAFVGQALVTIRATDVLRRLPATWSTPMDFIMFTGSTDRALVDNWLDTT